MQGLSFTALPQSQWTEQYLLDSLGHALDRGGGRLWADFPFALTVPRPPTDETPAPPPATDAPAKKRSVSGIATAAQVTRNGWKYDIKGMELGGFKSNPVVLAGHMQVVPATLEPAVVALVGSLTKRDNELVFRNMEFDTDPLADAWYRKVVSRHVRMVSVGTWPLEWEYVEETNKKGEVVSRYILFSRSELLEISVCAIGANRVAYIDPPKDRDPDKEDVTAARIAALETAIDELRSLIVPDEGFGLEADDGAGDSYGDASFPDAAFIVERGAPREGGKTVHKYRHLPHHKKSVSSGTDNGSVDIPHLRNALARAGQVKPVSESKDAYVSRAKSHLNAHARTLLKSHKSELEVLESLGLPDLEEDADDSRIDGAFASLSRLKNTFAQGGNHNANTVDPRAS